MFYTCSSEEVNICCGENWGKIFPVFSKPTDSRLNQRHRSSLYRPVLLNSGSLSPECVHWRSGSYSFPLRLPSLTFLSLTAGNALSVSSQLPPIMSHNYPYRRPASDRDHRPEAGHYSSADRHRSSSDHDFYRPPAESYPSSSSSRATTSAQRTQDGALSILSSCGLEPSDLALLAKLPEDVLTVESLPSVLKQIKGKRGTINSFCPSTLSPSSSSSSYPRPPVSSSGDWDRPRSQAVQYPLHHVAPSSVPSDLWRNPRTSSSVWSDPLSASSSSSTYVDLHHRSGPSELGKTGRNPGPVSSQVHHSFSSVGQRARSRPTGHPEPRSADYRSAPRPELYHLKPRVGHRETQTSSTRKRTWNAAATLMPSEKEALDFHGTCPTVFPYSCSLCDIAVLSERVSTRVLLPLLLPRYSAAAERRWSVGVRAAAALR